MARINTRLVFSAGFSLLLHILVLYSLAGMLTPKGQASGSTAMTVQLMPRPAKQAAPVADAKPALLSTDLSDFKVHAPEQPNKETVPQEQIPDAVPDAGVPAQHTAEDTVATPPPAGSPGGTGFFPRAISLPWTAGLQMRPVEPSRPTVANYQKMTQMRAAQQAIQNAQEVVRQLNESLGAHLIRDDLQIKGSCELENDQSAEMVCKPKRLAKLLRGSDTGIAEALRALRKAQSVTGDSYIEFNAGRLAIVTRENIQDAKSPP